MLLSPDGGMRRALIRRHDYQELEIEHQYISVGHYAHRHARLSFMIKNMLTCALRRAPFFAGYALLFSLHFFIPEYFHRRGARILMMTPVITLDAAFTAAGFREIPPAISLLYDALSKTRALAISAHYRQPYDNC